MGCVPKWASPPRHAALTAHDTVTQRTDFIQHCVLKSGVARVTKSRFAIVFLMFLALGLSVGLPAEDVMDTTYDESEALPSKVLLCSQSRRR